MICYKLRLTYNNVSKYIQLFQVDSESYYIDYFDEESKDYVYNDYYYNYSVIDDNNKDVTIDSLYVNDEKIDGRDKRIFLDCFGLARIEVVIDGMSYISQNIRVLVKELSINQNLKNMIDYIYDNCDNYLYEEHKHSKTFVGIKSSSNVSIDSKLSLLEEIYDIYIKSYNILKNSAQSKLINDNKIGDFSNLQNIGQKTINYIVNHPEELSPVNYNSGIYVNKQYYEPRKTLIQSVAYSYDIYENQVIVSFLKRIIQELEKIRIIVDERRGSILKPDSNGYIDSSFLIYSYNRKLMNRYIESLDIWISKLKRLYAEYKIILNVSNINISAIPEYTNVFRTIMPYNKFFVEITKWFNCGNYDLKKSDLLLSFISVSKIYEYFCLLKLIKSVELNGYDYIRKEAYKYKEDLYYKNTIYNNTFEFKKEKIRLTLYFQPVIYGDKQKKNNDIDLIRNTSIGISDVNIRTLLNDKEPSHGRYYTPDFLIKITSDLNEKSYHILDAKHSAPNSIKRYQLPALVFKYLFSISTESGHQVDGLCILSGKEKSSSTENLYDYADKRNVNIIPYAQICCISGDDVDNDEDLKNYIYRISNKN